MEKVELIDNLKFVSNKSPEPEPRETLRNNRDDESNGSLKYDDEMVPELMVQHEEESNDDESCDDDDNNSLSGLWARDNECSNNRS
mmetsp:Transcript_38588/g.44970  ORF Transcript_38588/g.44970 Transcript_38588/m.44970 type:complete len:86 (-) Transcript_38588:185-442(-)